MQLCHLENYFHTGNLHKITRKHEHCPISKFHISKLHILQFETLKFDTFNFDTMKFET